MPKVEKGLESMLVNKNAKYEKKPVKRNLIEKIPWEEGEGVTLGLMDCFVAA